ncbi:TrmH family RNA methyltransferase [Caldimonas brevitalea]|uniref:rRNA methyltransferase n=1 Tax=Caldimonas brevitalea TaxID=413882 RepID=A0A0G3BR34_9BURK|nr:RNA methyltransferase [Caldimonas brevitalea]AKJ29015.1 rRNA methyltransferase [Caldimonas brevitalea]
MTIQPLQITSRDNPLLLKLRKLAQDPAAYRKLGEIWVEGDHLCAACLTRNVPVRQGVFSQSAWEQPALRALARGAPRVAVVPDALFKAFSGLESPTGCGYLLPLDEGAAVLPGVATVVLDRLQDAGNAGSVLRSAAALGVRQIVALKGTVALWSPKVLRAGMGAHFGLHLVEQATLADLDRLGVPLVGTSSHTPAELHQTALPSPCAWVLGHEGQGIEAELLARCALTVRIPQPGGEESLNVAAAAAICLYESLRQRPAA